MKIHVVSFQVPYPADYGGAIDVFYKLQALREEGFDITLHTYVYGERKRQPVLEQLCSEVYYYPRLTGWRQQLSMLPYIVSTRRSQRLLSDLCKDDAPILFEGLHTCYHLNAPCLKNRVKAVRMHNIEHEYYSQLARQSKGWKRLYYHLESWRLRRYEQQLNNADVIYAITEADRQSLAQRISGCQIVHMPCFFDARFPEKVSTTLPYVLFHGNLAVEENAEAVRFIFKHVAPRLPQVSFVVAGHAPHFKNIPENVQVIADPADEQINELISQARVHLLITFQVSGIKLKLVNALVKGSGHVIANRQMLCGHSLGRLCTQADSAEEMASCISKLMTSAPSPAELEERKEIILEIRKSSTTSISGMTQAKSI